MQQLLSLPTSSAIHSGADFRDTKSDPLKQTNKKKSPEANFKG